MKQKNIALFIDYENFQNKNLNVKIIIDKLKERGRLIIKKTYADWGRFANGKRQMLINSVELIELPSHGHNKNSADIKLVVDALEIAITKKYIDTIVVVSGDSDYTPLISKLREYNKYVIVIGSDRKSTSPLLTGFCDELLFYSDLSGKIEDSETTNLKEAYELLLRATFYLSDRGLETRGSQIKQHMVQLNSSFSELQYGFKQFKQFLERAKKDKIINIKYIETNGDYLVSPKENTNHVSINLSKDEGLDIQLDKLIYFAYKAIANENEEMINTSNLMPKLKMIDSEFSLLQYGFPKSKGFKGLLKTYEERGLIKLEYQKEKNQYYSQLLPNFEELASDFDFPPNWTEIKIRSLLEKTKRYTLSLKDIHLIALEMLENFKINNPTPFDELYNLSLKTLSEKEIKLVGAKRAMRTIIDSECIMDIHQQPITDTNSQQIVFSIDTIEDIDFKTEKYLRSVIEPQLNDSEEIKTFEEILHEENNKLKMLF